MRPAVYWAVAGSSDTNKETLSLTRARLQRQCRLTKICLNSVHMPEARSLHLDAAFFQILQPIVLDAVRAVTAPSQFFIQRLDITTPPASVDTAISFMVHIKPRLFLRAG
jgi:hypothetical protein